MKDTTQKIPTALLCWRTQMAFGNGRFRKNATYDVPVNARQMRRMMERQAKKESKR